MAPQVEKYFLDIKDPEMKTALALVHSRYSTNTFPSWGRAQPMRMIAHNGEINTVRGNQNWMRAREKHFVSEIFGEDVKKIFPIVYLIFCVPKWPFQFVLWHPWSNLFS